MDPAGRRHFGNQILRILDIVLQHRNHGGILLREEGLGHRTTFLAHTNLFRMEQQTLHIAGGITARHKGDGKERTHLGTNLTAIVLKGWLVAQDGIGINGRIIKAKSLSRINQELIHCHGIYTGGFGNQIRGHVATRTHGLGIKGFNAAQVISRMG